MANFGITSDAGNIVINKQKSDCTVCGKCFDNLKSALQHELKQHIHKSLKKKPKAQKKLETLKNIKSETRAKLLEQLQNKRTSEDILNTILLFYKGNIEQNCELILQQLNDILKQSLNCNLYPYGSAKLGLDLKDSDIDIYAKCQNAESVNENWLKKNCINKSGRLLYRSRLFKNVISIRSARVPIVRCEHIATGIHIDLNFHTLGGMYNTKFLDQLIRSDVRIKQLMLFLKIWANENCIVQRSCMSSYTLTMLILFALEQPIARSITKFNCDLQAILPPLSYMQWQCQPKIYNGINYQFNFFLNGLPENMTVVHLMEHFFNVMSHINFSNFVVSPHFGVCIPRKDFHDQPSSEYLEQKKLLSKYYNCPMNDINLNVIIN